VLRCAQRPGADHRPSSADPISCPAAHGCPGTGRSRSPPSRPDAVPHEQDQAVTLAPSAPIAARKVTATGAERRIVQVGPSSVKGTPRSFLTASQKGSSGPTLERRSLCRPSGPDGEGQARGQARNARGAKVIPFSRSLELFWACRGFVHPEIQAHWSPRCVTYGPRKPSEPDLQLS
jgi:hypothetical protein